MVKSIFTLKACVFFFLYKHARILRLGSTSIRETGEKKFNIPCMKEASERSEASRRYEKPEEDTTRIMQRHAKEREAN